MKQFQSKDRRPRRIYGVVALLAGLLAALAGGALAAEVEKPNFIVILADDLGYADLGCYGQKRIKTPRLDQMASEGVRFTDFYVAASVCTPSRAALLTGSYPHRVGLGVCMRERPRGDTVPWHVLYPNSKQGLNPGEVTIAELLKQQEYATACVGKWHLGDAPEFLPTRHGFDSYYGIPYSNDMKPTVILRDEKVVGQANQDTLIEQYTSEAVRYIEEHTTAPFFLYLAHNAPHTPLHTPDKFRGQSEGGLYGDVVESLDWSTGEVLDTLRRTGLDKKTLVVFLSDNGPWLVRGEEGGFATPLRNGKGSSYEGGFRVPFLAWWPGAIAAGTVCSEPASAMDLLPTFARMAGGTPPADRIIDGKDIAALLQGRQGARSPHEALYYYLMDELQAVRSGPWKLKFETTLGREDVYQQVSDKETTVPERLYHLPSDPGEQKSVLKDRPKVHQRLSRLAEEARQDLGDSRRGVSGKNLRPARWVEGPSR